MGMTPFEQGYYYTMKLASRAAVLKAQAHDPFEDTIHGGFGLLTTGGAGALLAAEGPTLTDTPWERFKDDVSGDKHDRTVAGLVGGTGLGAALLLHPRTRRPFLNASATDDIYW
jgi:hypothetical protein